MRLPRSPGHLLALAVLAVPTHLAVPPVNLPVNPPVNLCACEVSYMVSGSGGSCACSWSFVPSLQREGECSPEPSCSAMTFCKVGGTLKFGTTPGSACSGIGDPMEAFAPCNQTGVPDTAACPGGSATFSLTVICAPCTPQ